MVGLLTPSHFWWNTSYHLVEPNIFGTNRSVDTQNICVHLGMGDYPSQAPNTRGDGGICVISCFFLFFSFMFFTVVFVNERKRNINIGMVEMVHDAST